MAILIQPFFCSLKNKIYKRKEHYISKIGIYFDSNCTDISNFPPLEVVGRGSEIQLQVGKY